MRGNGWLTKDDRRNVIVAKDRVDEADLLLFWPDDIYETGMQCDVGERDERQAYLSDSRDLGRSIHRRFVLIEEWAEKRNREVKDAPYRALTEYEVDRGGLSGLAMV
jgi:hypothetical protein